jgi:hypothetical protein
MKAKLILLAGGCAIAFAAPAAAAPGHCFSASGQPIGPVYDTERPDTAFITWVQARGGECRALRADEVTLYRGQPTEYPSEFRRTEIIQERPLDASPGAPRSVPDLPPPPRLTWQGDPVVARRLIVTHYRSAAPDISVTDTGRVVALSQGGAWRIYETVYPDGSRRQVAVQMRPDRQYLLMESTDGGSRWSETVELEN